MTILLKQAKVYSSSSAYHHQVVDILVKDGIIAKIDNSLTDAADHVVNNPDLGVSIGWIDGMVSFGEPGYEERETLQNGLQVAAKSGFTHLLLQPNTQPVADDAQKITWVIQKTKSHLVNILPVGALTKQSQGENMAELFDMHNNGAVAFSDYQKPLKDSLLMKICLQYAKDFEGLIMPFSQDQYLLGKGYANEGATATKLGLKGIPSIAEAVAIARNLTLLKYTGGKMHIPLVSTQEGVELIKQAKAGGLNVSCSLAAHHLLLSDEHLQTFDANYKVMPPLRDEATRQALLKAVEENVIDIIVSDHFPLDIEHKKLEFDLASYGTIGLESIFGSLCNLLNTDVVIDKLTNGYAVFGQTTPEIAIGAQANLTCFDTKSEWEFSPSDILSTSKNSAFLGVTMKGKPLAVINQNQIIFS